MSACPGKGERLIVILSSERNYVSANEAVEYNIIYNVGLFYLTNKQAIKHLVENVNTE